MREKIIVDLMVIILAALSLLCYTIQYVSYKRGFENGVKLGKAWSKPDTTNKVDMVAMLTDIQLEIEEMPMHYDPRDVSDLIQQKIDSLKGKTND